MNELFRNATFLLLVAAIGVGLWLAFESLQPLLAVRQQLVEKEAEIAQLNDELERERQEVQRLDTALRLMKVDHRVAQMAVVNQWRRAADGQLMTKLLFAEVDEQGQLLEDYRTMDIEGDIAYVDAWVAKFMDEHVEAGVPLRSTSLCLFRRLFGENQRPREGFALDTVGAQPAAYRGSREMSDVERDIWAHFWHYANDPTAAEKVGLRAVQGEAPSIRLVDGGAYWILLRASDGLTIKRADAPVPALTELIRQQRRSIRPASFQPGQSVQDGASRQRSIGLTPAGPTANAPVPPSFEQRSLRYNGLQPLPKDSVPQLQPVGAALSDPYGGK